MCACSRAILGLCRGLDDFGLMVVVVAVVVRIITIAKFRCWYVRTAVAWYDARGKGGYKYRPDLRTFFFFTLQLSS